MQERIYPTLYERKSLFYVTEAPFSPQRLIITLQNNVHLRQLLQIEVLLSLPFLILHLQFVHLFHLSIRRMEKSRSPPLELVPQHLHELDMAGLK